MKKVWIALFMVICIGGVIYFAMASHTPPSDRAVKPEEAPKGDMTSPAMNSAPPFSEAKTVKVDPEPENFRLVNNRQTETFIDTKPKKLAPGRIYTATNLQPEPTPTPDLGDYAPINRIVMCQLVNTLDSSNGSDAPVIGVVTQDLFWRGKKIIGKNSEVHGRTILDKQGERILADGIWTVILTDDKDCFPGNRELVLKAEALDREDDPEFTEMMAGGKYVTTIKKTWGITDGSKGIRGVIIKSNNGADIFNAFVASFIGGVAGTVNQFSSVIAPEQGGQQVNLPAYVAAPAAQGISSVMQQYAQQVMESIQKDGFFIRIPAGKKFKLYIDQDIQTGLAKQGASRDLNSARNRYLDDREIQEKVTQPRKEREEKKEDNNPMSMLNGQMKQIDSLSAQMREKSKILADQSDQQLNPGPSPTP